MTEDDRKRIEQVLQSELGDALFFQYLPPKEAPMHYVLDEIKERTGTDFIIYWVSKAFAEVFCLEVLGKVIVVFSTRYISISYVFRSLFSANVSGEQLVQLAEKSSLGVIAEMALRRGDADFAALAFARAMSIQNGITIVAGDEDLDIWSMELGPKDESYMALWFLGLTHELGHFTSSQDKVLEGDYFNNERMIETISIDVSPYPEWFQDEVLRLAQDETSESIVELNNLRNEGYADVFAISVLFSATRDLMGEIDDKEFNIGDFIYNIICGHAIISLIDKCRRVASSTSISSTADDVSRDFYLSNIGHNVRSLFVRFILNIIVTLHNNKSVLDNEGIKQANLLIDKQLKIHNGRLDYIMRGLGNMVEFTINETGKTNHVGVLKKFQNIISKNNELDRKAANDFGALAKSLKIDGRILQQLVKIIENPEKEIVFDTDDAQLYYLYWMSGPGYSRPLGIDTPDGRLFYMFLDDSDLFNAIFTIIKSMFIGEYTVEKQCVSLEGEGTLNTIVASYFPEKTPFQIVMEGTEQFEKYVEKFFGPYLSGEFDIP